MNDNSLLNFLKSNPFWAVLIIIFMVLPIIGAIVHIVLKAVGRKGLDYTSPPEEEDDPNGTPGNGGTDNSEKK